jgi:ecotin
MCFRTAFLASMLLFSPWAVAGDRSDDLIPYPEAEPGFQRLVFRLPELPEESLHKVEILVGQVRTVDCNPTHFGGDLDRRIAQGWGFPYYVLPEVVGPISTMMACPPESTPQESFVAVRGAGFLQRYNSKLPVVTYVPEGFEVRYRIWTAGEEQGPAARE